MSNFKVDPHALLDRPPLPVLLQIVRLACLRHAASVHPEPGSNSQIKAFFKNAFAKVFPNSKTLLSLVKVKIRFIVFVSITTKFGIDKDWLQKMKPHSCLKVRF